MKEFSGSFQYSEWFGIESILERNLVTSDWVK